MVCYSECAEMGGVNSAYLVKSKRVDYFYMQANNDDGVVGSLLKRSPRGENW